MTINNSSIHTNRFIICGNGDISIHMLNKVNHSHKHQLIALDGAANQLYTQGIYPNYLVGDFDSIDAQVKTKLEQNNVIIVPTPDQNYTDLEKAICYCDHLSPQEIILIGVLGTDRSDHNWMAYSCLKKYYKPSRRLRIYTNHETIEYFHNTMVDLEGRPQSHIGIFGFPSGQVTSQGLQWELHDYRVELGQQESCGNILTGNTVTLKIIGDVIVTLGSLE